MGEVILFSFRSLSLLTSNEVSNWADGVGVEARVATAGAQWRRRWVAVGIVWLRHETHKRLRWYFGSVDDCRLDQLRNSFRWPNRRSRSIRNIQQFHWGALRASNLRRLDRLRVNKVWNGRISYVGIRRCICGLNWWELCVNRRNLRFAFRQRRLDGDCWDLFAGAGWWWIFRFFCVFRGLQETEMTIRISLGNLLKFMMAIETIMRKNLLGFTGHANLMRGSWEVTRRLVKLQYLIIYKGQSLDKSFQSVTLRNPHKLPRNNFQLFSPQEKAQTTLEANRTPCKTKIKRTAMPGG